MAPELVANLDEAGPPAVPVVSVDEERLVAVEASRSVLQRTRDSISDVSGPTLRPILERQIESRRILAENLRRNNSVIVHSPAPSHSTPDPSVVLEEPSSFFNEDILRGQENQVPHHRQGHRGQELGAVRRPLSVLWEPPPPYSPPLEVYQDPSLHQIPVLPTPSSAGDNQFFPAPPSYEESVMAPGDNSRPGDGPGAGGGGLGDDIANPELRRMRDGVASSVVRLKTYLNLYKPSKYSPEVCRAKEEVWTDKIERALLDLNEHTFRLKDFDAYMGRTPVTR